MIGKIIGAAAGAAAGKATSGMTGTKGAIIGTLAVAAARRMGLLGLVAAGGGAYLLKRAKDKREAKNHNAPGVTTPPVRTVTPPVSQAA